MTLKACDRDVVHLQPNVSFLPFLFFRVCLFYALEIIKVLCEDYVVEQNM